MRRSGLAHLLSVSGLHLTAVVGAVMLLTLKLLALSPTLALRFRLVLVAAGAGALAGIAYTLLTGAEVPTIRSCIAALLVLLGIALGREALTLRLVAVAALVVLLLWPESLPGASFQMSFAAITAIVALHEHPRVRALLARREELWPMKLGRFVLGLVLTGLAVELALIPIALWHFHQAGLYGALANIVAIPLTTFVIMPLEALALLFDLAGLGAPFWWLAGAALDLLLGARPRHRRRAGRGGAAADPAGGRLRADGRRRPVARPVADALAALGPRAGRRRRRRGAARRRRPTCSSPATAATSRSGPPSGELALLRGRAGDYVRDLMTQSAGLDGEPGELEALPDRRMQRRFLRRRRCAAGACSPAGATGWCRSRPLRTACAEADIVVSDRRLPAACRPRWLKADRDLLARTRRPGDHARRARRGSSPSRAATAIPGYRSTRPSLVASDTNFKSVDVRGRFQRRRSRRFWRSIDIRMPRQIITVIIAEPP